MRVARALPFVFVAIAAVAAAACASSPDGSRASQTTTTAASFRFGGGDGRVMNEPFNPSYGELAGADHPANLLGTAACERKQECDEIGDGKPHADQHACLTSTRRHAHERLDSMSCENGLDAKQLAECIKSVRTADCASVDKVDSMTPCARTRLCKQ